MFPRKKPERKVLTSKNAARANARRHREELEQNPLYEHDIVHSSENVIRVGLSTSSVYPMTVSECFSTAARLGYDGVEVMVTNNAETQDADLMRDLVQETGLPVMSLHAPTLLFMPRVLDRDHWQKLRRTCDLAETVGARTVVLHPPFRWQGEYAKNFAAGVKAISEETGITLAVENMYPWRAGIREVLVYLPHWNPVGQDYDAVTFDFSHASTAGMNAIDTVKELFDVLQHVHLTDGSGSLQDEHLVPGRGRMPVAETLQHLAKHDWEGDVVVEVNTRFVAKKSTRDEMLVESLEFARRHLGLEDL
ncbi:sugar phosphate isomerase/epimerase [Brevibacterium daeguense]|uniref:Sugar phosphate isomerase/epimerase n=1 Tax=Brevibacterium daeguense TaxID=909936 RepID=A0ABP8ELG3_9MICO|nr:sugar phosphate isomerase/epimerase [Brevibacterium daeguense]